MRVIAIARVDQNAHEVQSESPQDRSLIGARDTRSLIFKQIRDAN
jgi:hypothetical protein